MFDFKKAQEEVVERAEAIVQKASDNIFLSMVLSLAAIVISVITAIVVVRRG